MFKYVLHMSVLLRFETYWHYHLEKNDMKVLHYVYEKDSMGETVCDPLTHEGYSSDLGITKEEFLKSIRFLKNEGLVGSKLMGSIHVYFIKAGKILDCGRS